MPQKRNGRYTNDRSDDSRDPAEGLQVARVYDCQHEYLSGEQRCLGCGRTQNEIALDEEL